MGLFPGFVLNDFWFWILLCETQKNKHVVCDGTASTLILGSLWELMDALKQKIDQSLREWVHTREQTVELEKMAGRRPIMA